MKYSCILVRIQSDGWIAEGKDAKDHRVRYESMERKSKTGCNHPTMTVPKDLSPQQYVIRPDRRSNL